MFKLNAFTRALYPILIGLAITAALYAISPERATAAMQDARPARQVSGQDHGSATPKVTRAPWMVKRGGSWRIDPIKMGWHLNKQRFGVRHWPALKRLWHYESRWQPFKPGAWGRTPLYNRGGSGACGIPQALPCSKIPNPRSVRSQIKWGLGYIAGRFLNPTRALAFWLAHGWY
jgi:hypothetical protein